MRLQRRYFDNTFFRYIKVRDFLWSTRWNPTKSRAQIARGSLPLSVLESEISFHDFDNIRQF